MTTTNERGASATTVAIAIAIAAIAGLAGYWIGTRAHPAPATPAAGASDGPVLTDETGRRVLYWHDPMVPGQKFDKPGKSPFMDMMLVPVYADAAADRGEVSVSPRLVQNLGVRTVAARAGTLDTEVRATGTVAVDERTLIGVQSRVQGFVERLHVRATFDPVRAGQPIADLFVPDWVAAQEELLALRASRQPGALALVDSARQRLRLLGMPDDEIARVEREGRSSGRVSVASPVGGIVWEIGARDGMAVMPGTNLVRIAGLASVWVIADVPEAQAALVAVGMPVEVRSAAQADRPLRGVVQALLPEVNAASRTVRARIELANPGGALKPGMYATVAFRGPKAQSAVLVPSEAVIRTGTRNVVIVASGEGRFMPVGVDVGRESGDLTEIVDGVEAGTRVVASGQFLIDSEASLRGVLARMNAGGEPAPVAPAMQTAQAAPVAAPADPHAGHRVDAPPPGGSVRHRASGTVRAISGADVFIQHGAIPTAGMGAMTMGFKAPASGVPAGVKPGTRVDFEFTVTPSGDLALVRIVPSGAAPGAPR